MIDSLCLFLNDYEMHPLLKAAIAQAYVLLVRPYDEGNERLARLLSYSILLVNVIGCRLFRHTKCLTLPPDENLRTQINCQDFSTFQ